MKLQGYLRIIKGDYPQDSQDLVEKLSNSINLAIDTIYDALNNKLTFSDNVACTVADVTLTVDSIGNPKTITSVKLMDGQTTVSGLIVIDCFTADKFGNPPPAAPFVSFTKGDGIIKINNVKGLTAYIPYTIKIIVLA